MATSDHAAETEIAPAPASARLSIDLLALATPRRVVHIGYFAFAIVALIVLCLMVPDRTTRADELLLYAGVLWTVATLARYVWAARAGGDAAAVAVEPAHLFLVVLAATYVVFAFDLTNERPRFSPGSPDALPGLTIDAHVYYILVFTYVISFIAWYAQQRERLLESALAVQIVLFSLMFEPFLRTEAGLPAFVLAAMGFALVRFWPWDGASRDLERSVGWMAIPLASCVAAALLATVFGAFVHDSLAMTAKIAAMAFLALLAFDVIREERQRWLVWLAMVAPAVTVSALITLKLVDIARVMGVSFALGKRFEMVTVIDPNPIGLSLAFGLLLVVTAIPRLESAVLRWAAAATLCFLLPAFIAVYSAPALLGLGGGLGVLVVLYVARAISGGRHAVAAFAAPALFVLVGLSVIALYTIPPPTREGIRATLDDPSTGRSRANLWSWSLREIRDNPLIGVGPGYYRVRTESVPSEFPFRDVTRMLERRRLLGGDGTQWRIFVHTHPHNIFLAVAEGMGTVGLLAFAAVAFAVCAAAWRIISRPDRDEWWLAGLGLAMLVAAFLWAQTALGQNIALFPLLGWMALGFVALSFRSEGERPVRLPQWLRPPAVHVASLVAGAALIAVFVVRPIAALSAFEEGSARFARGDRLGAEAPLELAATFDPTDPVSLRVAAFSELQYGRYDEALDSLREAVDRNPHDPLQLVLLGHVQWLTGDTMAAERSFRRAIDIDPWQAQGWDAYTPLALLLASQGDIEEAQQTFARVFWLRPASVADAAWVRPEKSDRPVSETEIRLDRAYLGESDPAKSQTLEERLLQRLNVFFIPEEKRPSGGFAMNRVLELMEAEARDVLKHDSTRGVEMLVQLASVYNAAQLYTQALPLLEEAATLEPAESYILYDVGTTHMVLRHYDEARLAFERVVRIGRASKTYDVRLPFAERNLALIAMDEERYSDAATLMERALDHYRWSYLPLAHVTLIQAYEAQGLYDEAARWRRKDNFLAGR